MREATVVALRPGAAALPMQGTEITGQLYMSLAAVKVHVPITLVPLE
jgi:hypothetical protein